MRTIRLTILAAALAGGLSAQLNTWQSRSEGGTGSAPPTQASLAGGVSSGLLAGIVACDSSASLTMTTATTTQLVALQSGKSVYICGFVINGGGSTTTRLVQGTGTNCGTGTTNITPAFNLTSGTAIAHGGGLGYLAKNAAGSAVCATNSAAATSNIFLTYTQF
jgi:hypothetical protein